MPFEPNPEYWTCRVKPNGTSVYVCEVCLDNRERTSYHCKEHEKTDKHREALQNYHRLSTSDQTPGYLPATLDEVVIDDGLRALLASATSNPSTQPMYPPDHPSLPLDTDFENNAHSPSPVTGINWGLYAAREDPQVPLSPIQEALAYVAETSLQFLDGDLSEDEMVERLSVDSSSFSSGDENLRSTSPTPSKRSRDHTTDPKTRKEWYPWQDRITCTLDIFMHLPRSVYSETQLQGILWLLGVNRVRELPSVRQMKKLNAMLQNMCGIDTIPCTGVLGHIYHVNNLSQILAQEMANPQVRPNVHIYPEDSGAMLSEARQGQRWLKEMPPDELTPMIRIGEDDYYIYEPAMLVDGSCCIPTRWFTREGDFYCKAWPLRPISSDDGDGWQVREDIEIEVAQRDFLKDFPTLAHDHQLYGVPHPSRILGMNSLNKQLLSAETFLEVRKNTSPDIPSRWIHTNPVLGNRWRAKAQGKRVAALPLWVYCDDTSGNVSKKWNEHNSFLFTLAGLPGHETSKEFNIHFLCTSNLAPPLEMLDGVVDQLETAQREGVWAWDCVNKEPILVFPSVLALLGDNPMQSEFACHIGLRGKYFCRTCMVKGPDAADDPLHPVDQPNETMADPSPETSEAGSDGASEISDTTDPAAPSENPAAQPKKRRGKLVETMSSMVTRITAFLKPGQPRTRSETMTKLGAFFNRAKEVGAKTVLKKMRTESGVKDTVQEHFLDKLSASYKGKHGTQAKQAALDSAVQSLPPNITSAVWRIKGLDPHQDTPVEILHVVLLGFIKYFWRDLIQNQLKNKDDKKDILIQRLCSFNISGLNLSPLNGKTLVQYAGSLTGRDFRAISQVAPFVIYDLVPSECYDAWVALSKLVPLIWQPAIEDINEHIRILEAEIESFLLRTARWTSQWFNKPKFHILLHLPFHIRRFGPAILFATEAFESFNAVIRAKSVHSNRQAPSRDIGRAFAQGNRMRHLLSGGFFVPKEAEAVDPEAQVPSNLTHPIPIPQHEHYWHTIGPGPQQLVSMPSPALSSLGLSTPKTNPKRSGECKSDQERPRPFSETDTGQRLPTVLAASHSTQLFKTSESVFLVNEDKCRVGDFVMVQSSQYPNPVPSIARVVEIIQLIGSAADHRGIPDGVLLQRVEVLGISPRLTMPRVLLQDSWQLVQHQEILCTVNTPHECELHNCQNTGFRHVFQERTKTSHTMPIVEHRGNLGQFVLNSAQMRDAKHVQKHRIPSQPLDFDRTIHESAAKAIDTRKAADALLATSAAKKARPAVRARGRGSGQRGRGRGSLES